MFKKLYFKSWFIKAVFYVCTLIILFVGSIAYVNVKSLFESSELVRENFEVNVEIEQLFSHIKDAETGHRGFVVTKDSSFLKPYTLGRENINNSFAELKTLTKDDPKQKENLQALNNLINLKMESFQKSYKLASTEGIESKGFKANLIDGSIIMDAIRAKVKNMINYENKRSIQLQKAHQDNLSLTPKFLFFVLLLTLILMFAAYSKIASNLRKLKKTNQQLEIFKESASMAEIVSRHGSWVWNVEENTFEYSDNLYRLLGESPKSFEPTIENFMAFVHPEDLEYLNAEVNKMLTEEDLPYINYRVVHKDGIIKHLKAYGKTIVNEDGKKRLLGTTTDITDEIDNLQRLEERNFELERNNKELSAFNYVASHDLQEPLRKIQTFLSRLEDKEGDKFSESGFKYMERINAAAARMRLLIDDLLQFSRTNKTDKVLEMADLNALLENAKQDLSSVLEDEKALINVEELPVIKVIPFQIQQLFTNLLGNSLKYRSAERSPVISILYTKVLASDEERLPSKASATFYHKFTFEDNGIGFDNEYSEKIFILFNRLHNKDDYTGTGIGLSICKKIVENHKGYIFADGIPNKGAIFTIYLPRI
ncbi:CHASE3 domain-containing protein [Changchengzhania lutea]|uniref:CHASE3 domain-containing protein n=1 Tax=Changchengzhania lutea TaxID=2049305 RepID=UPI00115D8CA3|nr:CHASE3 domain-containing protein [Changchengzhania lutea]